MPNTTIDDIAKNTKLYTDVELAAAVSALQDSGQLAAFINNQQANVYSNIIKQKENTFQKVYGDLTRAGQVQEAVLLYNKRTRDLASVQDQIYDNQKDSADAIINDKNMANRKTEMNEWTVNNKKDTLFVFSSLFIMLSGLLLFTGLWRMQMIGTAVCAILNICLIVVFVLILVNRYQYTEVLRNKRYWNKQIFEGKYGDVPTPLCPNLVDSAQNALSQGAEAAANMQTDIKTNIKTAAANL
jgi:uncharacterized membrane protein